MNYTKLEKIFEEDLNNLDNIGLTDDTKAKSVTIISKEHAMLLAKEDSEISREKFDFQKKMEGEKFGLLKSQSKFEEDFKNKEFEFKKVCLTKEQENKVESLLLEKNNFELNKQKFESDKDLKAKDIELRTRELDLKSNELAYNKSFKEEELKIKKEEIKLTQEYKDKELSLKEAQVNNEFELKKEELKLKNESLKLENEKNNQDIQIRLAQLEQESKNQKRTTIVALVGTACTFVLGLVGKIAYCALSKRAQDREYEDYAIEPKSSVENRQKLN